MMTRVRSLARPVEPSNPTMEVNATGGTARWNSRRGLPPICCSALRTASSSAVLLPGSAAPNDSRSPNDDQDGSVGLVMQKSLHASSACSLNCSSVSAYCTGEDPMIRYSRGSRPAACRWNSPGSSLRLARSPVAPNSTMTWFSGLAEPFLSFTDAQAFFSACPPNSERMADRILPVNAPRSRDSKRSYSEAAMTEAGTPSSTAASTVHRPSPESDTRPLKSDKSSDLANAAAVRSTSQELTTEPRRHTSATWPGSIWYWYAQGSRSGVVSASISSWCRPTSALWMIDRPSAIAAIMPYSTPL